MNSEKEQQKLSSEIPQNDLSNFKDLPYMTEDELSSFISNAEINLTPQEIEYLRINRRRMSISKVCFFFFHTIYALGSKPS